MLKSKQSGFTLIELMIVVVIISILVGIAYPSYLDQIQKTRRTDAKTSLMDLAGRMERYYTEQNTYATATIGTGQSSDLLSSNITPGSWYTLTISNKTESSFTLQASPRNDQVNDTKCASLTYNQNGSKGITGTGSVTECW